MQLKFKIYIYCYYVFKGIFTLALFILKVKMDNVLEKIKSFNNFDAFFLNPDWPQASDNPTSASHRP